MAMIQGVCTVATDGIVTKTGAAAAVYDALAANLPAGTTIPAGAEGVGLKQALARQAVSIAALIPYVTANGQATIRSTDAGLQKTPTPNDAATATAAPGADKFLALV